MTDQYRACVVCFRQWVSQPGEVKCADCQPPAQPPPRRTPKPPLDLSQGLPENLAGMSLEDFLP